MNWEEAKQQTIDQWKEILNGIGTKDSIELVTEVNAVSSLCMKAREAAGKASTRCDFCIAFGDVGGCERVRLQLTEALLDEDWERSRIYVREVLSLLHGSSIPSESARQPA